MSNTNCLAGMKCPKCTSEGPFKVWTTALATVADHGVTDIHDFTWTEDDECECIACGEEAQVKDFQAKGAAANG